MEVFESLIGLLQKSIHSEDARAAWAELPEPEQLALCEAARHFHLESLFYYCLNDALPEGAASDFRQSYQSLAASSLRQEQALLTLEAVFRREKIRFAWLKGAWLVRRVYPIAALRPMVDLDVLIHPDDCGKALEVLNSAGWEAVHRDNSHPHHFSMMVRNGVALEPHYTLPRMDTGHMRALWLEWEEHDWQELPPELHLLILFQHARGHWWQNAMRLLLDCGFLLSRCEIDWRRLEELRRKFDMCSPGLLFAAFPDFFGETFSGGEFPPQTVQLFRKVIRESGEYFRSEAEFIMSSPERFSYTWWMERLHGLRPVAVMDKYHVGYRQLPGCYRRDLAAKFSAFWNILLTGKNPKFQRYWCDFSMIDACVMPEKKMKNSDDSSC